MPALLRPGVYVEETLNQINGPVGGGISTQAFIGAHYRGPTAARLIQSWNDFEVWFGGFPPAGTDPTELPFAVFNFFANGGRQCWVARTLGTSAVKATSTLVDRAGSPLSTLRIDALTEGAFGNRIRYSIVTRDAPNGKFDLVIFYDGTTASNIVERFTNLSMLDADANYVEKIVNSPTNGSRWVTVTDLDSVTAAPSNMPAAVTAVALASGADGAAPNATQRQNAVTAGTSPLDAIDGLVDLNLPAETTAAVLNAAMAYAETTKRVFVVIDTAAAEAVSTSVSWKDTLTVSGFGAVYKGWQQAIDPTSSTPGALRACPPGAFVLGKYAEVDRNRGVFHAPAGLKARLSNDYAVEARFSDTDLDTLNSGHINAIRQLVGAGIVVMGARTLAVGRADMYVNVRRTLNYIEDSLVRSTQFALFENNDQDLWNTITSVAGRFLGTLWGLGGLRGATQDEAFYVKCDAELNTPQVIEAGTVVFEVGVALQFPAEFVVARIGQWEGGQSVAEAA